MKYGWILLLGILVGCVRYQAMPLSAIPSESVEETQGVSIAAKAFTKEDCRRYLDRNVIHQGYQPVQIYIQNTSDTPYLFSTSRVTLPTATPKEVSKKMHTSTTGRIAGYGAATLLSSPLFAIPAAAVDGFQSAEKNENLDHDFQIKGAHDCVVLPHSYVNMILFVPRREYEETFTVTLIDEKTHKPIKLVAKAL